LLPARRHEISRLEAFSDAVFAFALTLLVVSLDVPTSYDELIALMAGFVPFAASFALLIWIWYEHNIFFRRYGLQDPVTIALNGVLLFVVLFYVYPLKFLFTAAFSFAVPVLGTRLHVSPAEIANLFAIYGAGFVVLFGMFALLYAHAYRRRDLLELTEIETFDLRAHRGGHLVSAGVGLLAVAVALFAPGPWPQFSGFVYFLMGPMHWIYGVTVGRRRRAFAARVANRAPIGVPERAS
jgi:uncharacterized membrane protein